MTNSKTWVFNSTISSLYPSAAESARQQYDVSFTCGDMQCSALAFTRRSYYFEMAYYRPFPYGDTTVFNSSGWQSESYKTITFSDLPSGDLLTWLQANATPQ